MANIESIIFEKGTLRLIDQRKLPVAFEYFDCKTAKDTALAISNMVVRGAPAIGAAAAYGIVLAGIEYKDLDDKSFLLAMDQACESIKSARPTAVNLMWAVDRLKEQMMKLDVQNRSGYIDALLEEARIIQEEDVKTNKRMAQYGNEIIKHGMTILTHCNTGALATAGVGTALGVICEAHKAGKNIFVYADETRPRLQGARLTAWELVQEGIPAKLIADSAAATLIRDGIIDVILVGADRVATNGDSANKIGTFMLSVIAEKYNVPFYIVAPTTTIDFDIGSGQDIEIEERSAEEITHYKGVRIAPKGIGVYNPAFDVTPNELITGIITERGIIYPPYHVNIPKLKEESF